MYHRPINRWLDTQQQQRQQKRRDPIELSPTTMPRGYLKRESDLVGQKKARGGSSRKAEFHRTPKWKRNHFYSNKFGYNNKYKDGGERRKRYLIDFPIEDQLNDYLTFSDWYQEELWVEECKDEVSTVDPPEYDDGRTFRGTELQGAPLELLSFSIPGDCIEENDSTAGDRNGVDSFSLFEASTDHSYSLCEEERTSKAGSSLLCNDSDRASELASFYLIESKSKSEENDSISSAHSSLWDFVECATGIGSSLSSVEHNMHAPIGSFVDDAGCSVISKLPEPSVTSLSGKIQPYSGQKCAICLEDKPSTCRIMQKCCHPAACMDCLRTHYMGHQMMDISNFPLRCFWPGCDRIVRDAQIQRLATSNEEMEFYYYQATWAKNQKREARRVRLQEIQYKHLQELRVYNLKVHQNCRVCSNTQPVHPGRDEEERVFCCEQCHTEQPIDVISAEEIKSLVHCQGDYLVNCPACEVLIYKDGGCDHMTCVCEEEFSFEHAQYRLRTYPRAKSRVVSFKDSDMKEEDSDVGHEEVDAGNVDGLTKLQLLTRAIPIVIRSFKIKLKKSEVQTGCL